MPETVTDRHLVTSPLLSPARIVQELGVDEWGYQALRICEFEANQIQQLRDVRIAEQHAVDQARMARETEESRMRKLLHDGEAQTEIVRLHPAHPVWSLCGHCADGTLAKAASVWTHG